MFCLDPVHPLFDAIMQVVTKEPGIAVGDLHKKLKAQKIHVTLQHLYRKVNELVDAQILLKQKTALTTNMMFLSYLEYFAFARKDALQQTKSLNVFPLKAGQRVQFEAHSLLEVQTLWNHLLVQAHHVAPQKYMFKYYSHAWWVWSKRTLDAKFYKKIYEKGVRCLWLYGNNTYLDREAASMYPDLFESRIALDVPFPCEGYNLNIYGDYIFECVLPDHVARHLALIFKTISSTKKEDLSVIDDVFSMRADYKVTVWHNAKQSAKMQKDISRYFLHGAKVMPGEEEK